MLEADVIAYYNAKVQASTSSEVISLEWVKKWNGILPVTMMGGTGSYDKLTGWQVESGAEFSLNII